jgi:hypothetical protein
LKNDDTHNHDRFENVSQIFSWFHSKCNMVGKFEVLPLVYRRRIPRYEHGSRADFGTSNMHADIRGSGYTE